MAFPDSQPSRTRDLPPREPRPGSSVGRLPWAPGPWVWERGGGKTHTTGGCGLDSPLPVSSVKEGNNPSETDPMTSSPEILTEPDVRANASSDTWRRLPCPSPPGLLLQSRPLRQQQQRDTGSAEQVKERGVAGDVACEQHVEEWTSLWVLSSLCNHRTLERPPAWDPPAAAWKPHQCCPPPPPQRGTHPTQEMTSGGTSGQLGTARWCSPKCPEPLSGPDSPFNGLEQALP